MVALNRQPRTPNTALTSSFRRLLNNCNIHRAGCSVRVDCILASRFLALCSGRSLRSKMLEKPGELFPEPQIGLHVDIAPVKKKRVHNLLVLRWTQNFRGISTPMLGSRKPERRGCMCSHDASWRTRPGCSIPSKYLHTGCMSTSVFARESSQVV